MVLASNAAHPSASSLIEVTPMGGALGAEVRHVDVRSFGDWQYAAFMRALLQHQVLLVRGQTLNGHDLIGFSRRLVKGLPEILTMSTVRVNATFSYLETPPVVSLIHAREVAPHPSGASFCSLYAIHASLPPSLRRRIARLKIAHAAVGRSGSGAVHPLVCNHPDTGRQMLQLGRRRQARLLGLRPAESEALLDQLWHHADDPEVTWEHQWRIGDLVIWDKRCTLQRCGPFEDNPGQVLSRTQITPRHRDTAA